MPFKCKVVEHVKNDGKLVQYRIETNIGRSYDFYALHRFSDFARLKTLLKHDPLLIGVFDKAPKLPHGGIRGMGVNSNKRRLEERRKRLQTWLDFCTDHPAVRRRKELIDFLGLPPGFKPSTSIKDIKDGVNGSLRHLNSGSTGADEGIASAISRRASLNVLRAAHLSATRKGTHRMPSPDIQRAGSNKHVSLKQAFEASGSNRALPVRKPLPKRPPKSFAGPPPPSFGAAPPQAPPKMKRPLPQRRALPTRPREGPPPPKLSRPAMKKPTVQTKGPPPKMSGRRPPPRMGGGRRPPPPRR